MTGPAHNNNNNYNNYNNYNNNNNQQQSELFKWSLVSRQQNAAYNKQTKHETKWNEVVS
jgi:hypothetical protein